MPRRRYVSSFYRSPRTTQERRASLERFDAPVKFRRRKDLCNSYDDIQVTRQRSWKWLRRRKQYRQIQNDYAWREYEYGGWGSSEWTKTMHFYRRLDRLGCYYRFKRGVLYWYGPEM